MRLLFELGWLRVGLEATFGPPEEYAEYAALDDRGAGQADVTSQQMPVGFFAEDDPGEDQRR